MGKDIKTREHPIYQLRKQQLFWNRLAYYGGRPYIDARLQRAANETNVSWEGDVTEGIVGRKARACLVNDAGRVGNKINQYLSSKPVTRDGADTDWLGNVTGDHHGIHEFIESVSTALTHGGWCWLQVDRAAQPRDDDGNPIAYTAESARRYPVRWKLYEALDVPDWHIDDSGSIIWLITRTNQRFDADPNAEPVDAVITTLYYISPDDGTVHITEEANRQVPVELRKNQPITGLHRIPFVLVGRTDSRPWWYDDVENIQCQILNLDSLHNENLTDGVYPQLVVPYSLVQSLDADLKLDRLSGQDRIVLQRELIKGRKNPLVEDTEDKGVTRYIQPNAGDMAQIVNEANRKRGLLFDMAGLALFNKETRQIQTAESKQFDQLDTNNTLINRSLILQHAEEQLIELSVMFNPAFKRYAPVYPTRFDVVDVTALSAAVSTISNMADKPPIMNKMLLIAGVKIVREIGGCDEEMYNAALRQIDEMPDEQETPKIDKLALLARLTGKPEEAEEEEDEDDDDGKEE